MTILNKLYTIYFFFFLLWKNMCLCTYVLIAWTCISSMTPPGPSWGFCILCSLCWNGSSSTCPAHSFLFRSLLRCGLLREPSSDCPVSNSPPVHLPHTLRLPCLALFPFLTLVTLWHAIFCSPPLEAKHPEGRSCYVASAQKTPGLQQALQIPAAWVNTYII